MLNQLWHLVKPYHNIRPGFGHTLLAVFESLFTQSLVFNQV